MFSVYIYIYTNICSVKKLQLGFSKQILEVSHGKHHNCLFTLSLWKLLITIPCMH